LIIICSNSHYILLIEHKIGHINIQINYNINGSWTINWITKKLWIIKRKWSKKFVQQSERNIKWRDECFENKCSDNSKTYEYKIIRFVEIFTVNSLIW